MNVLLITQEAPLSADQVVTGNAIRCQQITDSLHAGGQHQVKQVWFSADDQADSNPDCFHNRDSLYSLISQHQADILIVAYWELLDMLPFSLKQPVVLDFLAPRTLEVLYEQPEELLRDMQRLKNNLSKVDRIMIGHPRQGALLINLLMECGFDLRKENPLIVVPLGGEVVERKDHAPDLQKLSLVSGGVSWPWRRSETYWQAISEAADNAPSIALNLFGGQYRLHNDENPSSASDSSKPTDDSTHYKPLCAYQAFSQFLSEEAHIGLELAEHNIEREYSLSFRSIDFLRHGLPLICNRYLPIADLVQQYDAGWLVDNEEELKAVLLELAANPEQWKVKSEQALRLAREQLDPAKAVQPLLAWLEQPGKTRRIELKPLPGNYYQKQETELNTLPFGKRMARRFQLIKRFLIHKLLQSNTAGGKNVVIVTRSDLFPTDHGAAVKIVETARGLSNNQVDVAIVSDNRKEWWLYRNGEMESRRYPFWLRLFALPQSLVQLRHLSKDIPESNAFLYLPLSDRSFVWRSLYVGKKIGAGIFQAEFPAYARACIWGRSMLGARAVLVEHNVEYDRLKAQIPELTDTQYQNLKEIEISLCNQCDAVICVSDNDRQILINDGVNPSLISTIPHGVDLAGFESEQVADAREAYDIPNDATILVYHGTFAYEPNMQAIQVFNTELLPRLDDLGIHCHVLAVGRDAPKFHTHPRIHFTGSVDKVSPWLKAADIAVVPLIEGGGTRMKIIDYFASALPVISTSKGIEGIPVENGKQAIVEDDWGKMAAYIAELSKDKAKADDIAQQGHKIAESLDWTALACRYIAIFTTL